MGFIPLSSSRWSVGPHPSWGCLLLVAASSAVILHILQQSGKRSQITSPANCRSFVIYQLFVCVCVCVSAPPAFMPLPLRMRRVRTGVPETRLPPSPPLARYMAGMIHHGGWCSLYVSINHLHSTSFTILYQFILGVSYQIFLGISARFS